MLSELQIEVLRLKSHGYQDKVIAKRLHRETETIKYHLKEIRRKLDANSTAQMCFIAGAKGLVSANDSDYKGLHDGRERNSFTQSRSQRI